MRRFLAFALLVLPSVCFGADLAGSASELRSLKLAAPKKWAVVIGASDYAHMGVLKYARNDAQDFSQALVDDFQFKREDITLLIDKDRPQDAPTAKNIVASLDRVFADRRLDKGDLFIFYFAGHGVGTKRGDYLCPTDATSANLEQIGLPVRAVTQRIVAAGLKNVLIICDACRAGEQNPFGAELQQLGEKSNLAVLLGCEPGKRSYEYPVFKHGAFTHFLLQEMKSADAREGTGALWASSLAARVKTSVYEYTEPDYGKFAQRPASWSEKQADVFLGQFEPKTTLSLAAMAASLELAKSKGESAYAQGLGAAALYTLREGLPTMAVEQLKIMEGLGEMPLGFRMIYANTLRDLGRDVEARKQFGVLLALPPGDYYRNVALSTSDIPSITKEQQLDASMKLWQEDKTFDSAVWAWTLAREASVAKQRAMLAAFTKTYDPKTKAGLYFAAANAQLAGDRAKAIDLLTRCLDAPGSAEALHDALMKLYEIRTEAGEEGACAEIIARGVREDQGSIYFWLGLEARRLRDVKDIDGMMRLLTTGVASRAEPWQIYDYVDTAGSRCPELLPLLQKQRERHPFSWPIHAAIWVAENATDLEPSFTLSDEMKKYCGDPVELRLTVFKTLSRILTEKGPMGRIESLLFNTKFFISVNQFNRQFGADSSLWYCLQQWSENCRRTSQLAKVAEARLYPLVYAGKCSPDLVGTAMTIAMLEGDDANVDKIWKVAQAGGALKTDEAWRYLAYLIARGKNKEAELLLPKMPAPGRMIGSKLPTLVRAYFDAVSGKDKAKIGAILDANEPDGIESTYVWMFAAALIGREERASNFFTQLLLSDDQNNQHLKAAGLRWLWQQAVRDKKTEEMLVYADITASQFGNRLFAPITYVAEPKLADYAGTLTFDAQFSDEGGHARKGFSKMTIIITPDGKVAGKMDGLAFTGTVDRFGTLVATGVWDGDKVWLRTKMAPASIYRTYADKGGQPVEAFTESFEQILLELKPPASPGSGGLRTH